MLMYALDGIESKVKLKWMIGIFLGQGKIR